MLERKVEPLEHLHAVGSIKNLTTLENNLAFLVKLMEHLPYNPASTFLGIWVYPTETLIICYTQDVCSGTDHDSKIGNQPNGYQWWVEKELVQCKAIY